MRICSSLCTLSSPVIRTQSIERDKRRVGLISRYLSRRLFVIWSLGTPKGSRLAEHRRNGRHLLSIERKPGGSRHYNPEHLPSIDGWSSQPFAISGQPLARSSVEDSSHLLPGTASGGRSEPVTVAGCASRERQRAFPVKFDSYSYCFLL